MKKEEEVTARNYSQKRDQDHDQLLRVDYLQGSSRPIRHRLQDIRLDNLLNRTQR